MKIITAKKIARNLVDDIQTNPDEWTITHYRAIGRIIASRWGDNDSRHWKVDSEGFHITLEYQGDVVYESNFLAMFLSSSIRKLRSSLIQLSQYRETRDISRIRVSMYHERKLQEMIESTDRQRKADNDLA